MVRVPESLVEDVKLLISEHRNGNEIDIASCIHSPASDGELLAQMTQSEIEFFMSFRHYQNDIKKALPICDYLRTFEQVILKLPRPERKLIQKITNPKVKKSAFSA